MKKILFLFSFLFFLVVSTQSSYAVSITGGYSPSTVATGKDVTITIIIKDVPAAAVRINIGPSGSTELAPGIEEMSPSGCDNLSPSANWKNLTCSGSLGPGNTLTIKGDFNTTSLSSEAFFVSGRSYAAYVNGNQVPGSFIVGSAPSVPFSIQSVSPNPAKENDLVAIRLTNTTVGHTYAVYTDRDVNSTTCNESDCVLTFVVPYISNSNFSVKVLDRSTNPIQSLDVPITFGISNLGHNECDQSNANSCPNGSICQKPPFGFTACVPVPPCASGNNGTCNYVNTGFGMTIGTDPQSLIQSIFGLILSISGGIALLLIIISGYRMLSSQGNPEAIKGAREQLTAAIVGLVFIILSLVILQVIGYDILRIPAFK